MQQIDVVLTKEKLNSSHPNNPNTIAVVFDIIFATSSITAALEAGVNKIYVANNLAEAETIGKSLGSDYEIAGEKMAQVFSGYRSYEPLALNDSSLATKSLVYATTNGTVALRKSANFLRTYAASLRNSAAVVNDLLQHIADDKDILLICAGSHGHFSLEDFYGAGCLINNIKNLSPKKFKLSDAAKAAALVFNSSGSYEMLQDTNLGQHFTRIGKGQNLLFASQINTSDVVGVLQDNYIQAL